MKILRKTIRFIAITFILLAVALPNTILADFIFINASLYQTSIPTTFYVIGGTYVGTGSALSVTGMPCQPDFLMVKANGTAADDDAYVTWDKFEEVGNAQAGVRVLPTLAPDTNNFSSWNSDGFTIKADAGVGTGFTNKSGTTYFYIALCGAATEIKAGTYTGNGTAATAITGIGFQPDFMFIRRKNNTTQPLVWKTSGMGTASALINAATANTANYITSLDSDGFTVGNNGAVNGAAAPYNYIAFKIPSGAGDCGSYTGNATDDTDITTTAAITPEWVFIKADSTVEPVFRTTANSGDDSTRYNNSAANATNRIQAFNSNGFQIGTNGEVNTSATTYHYCALKDA